jgi:hypothetical protein
MVTNVITIAAIPEAMNTPAPDADAVGVLLKPIVQVIERHRRGNNAADDHQHDKIAREQQPNLRYGCTQHFADAYLFGALLGNVSGQPEQPKAGYKYGQPGKHARQFAHQHLQVKLVLILVVHKLVLIGISRVIFSKYLADLVYSGMRILTFFASRYVITNPKGLCPKRQALPGYKATPSARLSPRQ